MLSASDISGEQIKENKTLAVVINSRKNQSECFDAIRLLQMTALFPIHVYFYKNNGVSLTSVYNEIQKQITEERILFIHDDVQILTVGWAKELDRLFNDNPEYGIIGVAGSRDFDSDGAWWIYKNIYGQVVHTKRIKDEKTGQQGTTAFITKFSEKIENDLNEVAVIDGLFMAIDRAKASTNFDEHVSGFNFYDIDFCLSNYTTNTTKIGVTTKIKVQHGGVGVIKPEWFENRNLVLSKYKEYLPISDLNNSTQPEKKDMAFFHNEHFPVQNTETQTENK